MEIMPNESELEGSLIENLYSLFIHLEDEEKIHFNLTDKKRNEYLFKISETIATLPKDEFNVIGLDFNNP